MRVSWPIPIVIAVLALTHVGAAADPAELAGGVLIVHAPAGLEYSTNPPEGWCARYLSQYAITSCEQQVTRIDSGESRLWFVLAAWDEAKTFGRVEFGLGGFDPTDYVFDDWGICADWEAFSTTCEDWPAPNCGITIAPSTPWSGNFVPLVWFAGTAYAAGLIPLAESPSGYAGFQNEENPPAAWPAADLGALGLFQDGVSVCSQGPVIACCVEQECMLVMGENACLDLGGVPRPDEYDCVAAHCSVPAFAVCCLPFSDECLLVDEYDCHFMSGVWHPGFYDCATGPCPPTPAETTTWGQVKSMYKPVR